MSQRRTREIHPEEIIGFDEYVRWKNSSGPNEFIKILAKTTNFNLCSGHYKLTWDFVSRHLEAQWEWFGLSGNPNIPLSIIKQNLHLPWRWDVVSQRRSVTWQMITDNPTLPWDLNGVSKNRNITAEIVRDNPDRKWDYVALAKNLSIVPGDLRKVIEDRFWPGWMARGIKEGWASHPRVTLDVMNVLAFDRHPDPHNSNWVYLSINPAVTQEIVESRPDWPWDETFLKDNQNLSLEFIKKHYKDDSDFRPFSRNPNVTIDFILEFKDKWWDWNHLTIATPVKDILSHKDLPWDLKEISKNPTMTLDIIPQLEGLTGEIIGKTLPRSPLLDFKYLLENLNLPWDWAAISRNGKITAENILNHPELPWNRRAILANPNVTQSLVDLQKVERSDITYLLHENYLDLDEFRHRVMEISPTARLEEYKFRCVQKDIEKRRNGVLQEISEIFYHDICSVILLYVSYN